MKKELTYSQRVRKDRRWLKARALCIRLRQDDLCYLCKRPIDFTLKGGDPMSLEVDHIVPLTMGGAPFDQENLACTHKICNGRKSDNLHGSFQVKKEISKIKKESIEIKDGSGFNFLGGDWFNAQKKERKDSTQGST